MNYYDAKFARERKPRPSEWVIVPDGNHFRLVNVKRGNS